MLKSILFICALIGLFAFSTAVQAQNDSIWIDDGTNILATGHRAHDTLSNGWIWKTGDSISICNGSSITLTLNASYALINKVLWIPNAGPALPNPNAFSITVSPVVNTDYSGYVYEDVGGIAIYRGMVKISVIIAPDPQTYTWILDGVMNGDTAHVCGAGTEIFQYSGSQSGNTYQLYDWFTNLPVGAPATGDGNPINLTGVLPGTYYLYINNGVCGVFDF